MRADQVSLSLSPFFDATVMKHDREHSSSFSVLSSVLTPASHVIRCSRGGRHSLY